MKTRESRRTTVRAVESKPDASLIAMERILEQLEKLEVRQAQCESQLKNRNKFTRRNGQSNNVTCYACGEKGHYKSSCPHQADNGSTNYRPSIGNNYASNEKGRSLVGPERPHESSKETNSPSDQLSSDEQSPSITDSHEESSFFLGHKDEYDDRPDENFCRWQEPGSWEMRSSHMAM